MDVTGSLIEMGKADRALGDCPIRTEKDFIKSLEENSERYLSLPEGVGRETWDLKVYGAISKFCEEVGFSAKQEENLMRYWEHFKIPEAQR